MLQVLKTIPLAVIRGVVVARQQYGLQIRLLELLPEHSQLQQSSSSSNAASAAPSRPSSSSSSSSSTVQHITSVSRIMDLFRSLSTVELIGFCHVSEVLAIEPDREVPLEEVELLEDAELARYRKGDLVLAIVLSTNVDEQRISLSFSSTALQRIIERDRDHVCRRLDLSIALPRLVHNHCRGTRGAAAAIASRY
mgnify:FL=1